MKIKKSALTAMLALAMAVGLVVGANADNIREQIMASMEYTVTIKLDGEVVIPTDANGNQVYPIAYNGTTYLPLRTVAKMVGLEVGWDQASYSVLLASAPADGTDLIDTYRAYHLSEEYAISAKDYQTADKENKDISGIACSHWIQLRMNQYAAKGALCAASYNIGGKYDTVTFQYYSDKDVTLCVLGDNDYELAKLDVKGDQIAQTVTVDLLGTTQLKFQAEKLIEPGITSDKATTAYIFNAKLK